uniref:Uncharacterized protein n=1 Tax=Physcomitrium patens TaxID=3218 RepID=A0A7I4F1P4_PHYPA
MRLDVGYRTESILGDSEWVSVDNDSAFTGGHKANNVLVLRCCTDGGKKTVCRNQKGGSDKGAVVSRNEIKETTAANLWGKRAKDLGYKPKPAGYQKYKEYIQMLDG